MATEAEIINAMREATEVMLDQRKEILKLTSIIAERDKTIIELKRMIDILAIL
jgi:hypothetical protein